jgi:hypothetical protein
VAQANLQAARAALRLTDRSWAAPGNDAAGDLVVRAGVYSQYGLPQKALEALKENPDFGDVVAVQASMVETLVACGELEAALAALAAIAPPDDEARTDLRVRMLILEGRPEAIDESDDVDDDELVEDDDLLDDELLDDELLDDDDDTDAGAASAADDLEEDDLLDDELLDDDDDEPDAEAASEGTADVKAAPDDGLSSLFGGGFDSDQSGTQEADDDGLASLFSSSLADQGAAPSGGAPGVPLSPAPPSLGIAGPLADAEALLQVCAFDQAEAIASGGASLGHALVSARVRRARGDLSGALSALRGAVDDAPEDDPAYLPALIEMAELSIGKGKKRAARRLLDEVEDIDPRHSAERVSLVRRGLGLVDR